MPADRDWAAWRPDNRDWAAWRGRWSDEMVADMVEHTTLRRYMVGETLFKEGQTCEWLMFVVKGFVRVTRDLPKGPGDAPGAAIEWAVLSSGLPPACVSTPLLARALALRSVSGDVGGALAVCAPCTDWLTLSLCRCLYVLGDSANVAAFPGKLSRVLDCRQRSSSGWGGGDGVAQGRVEVSVVLNQ